MSNIYYMLEYKKTKDITPIKTSLIAKYPYEIVSCVGDNISVNKKVYVIGKIDYSYGGGTTICYNFYVVDQFSKEVN